MYEISSFSEDSFFDSCVEIAHEGKEEKIRTIDEVKKKSQLKYCYKYLKKLGCKSIIAEVPYVDRDYLEDYSAYYVKCYPRYPRKCVRLHFFKCAVTRRRFEKFIRTREKSVEKQLLRETNYLGFMVLKPLPENFVGRTCLITYDSEGGRRQYPTTREYNVHLAGLDLKVTSVAFQEQDRVTAACATSAVWVALHKAGRLFEFTVPTPSEITIAGSADSEHRNTPNDGLSTLGICTAIKASGLEVEFRDGERVSNARGIIYSYISIGLPVLLGVDLLPKSALEMPEDKVGPLLQKLDLGAHAITVTGFSQDARSNGKFSSDRINKIYAHDDNCGPFSRFTFSGDRTLETGVAYRGNNEEYRGEKIFARIFAIVVPVYHKMRISFEDAQKQVNRFTAYILDQVMGVDNLEWDLQLSFGYQIQKLAVNGQYPDELRHSILKKDWPRFVWRATARIDDQPILEIILDATDIAQSFFVHEILFFNKKIKKEVDKFVSQNKISLEQRLSVKWFEKITEAPVGGF